MTKAFRLYPIYFNSRVSRAKGRKVPVSEKCKSPTLDQISKVLASLKIEHKLEKKSHPKQTQNLALKQLPENAKAEEVERYNESMSGCIVINDADKKREIIKRVYCELNK